MRGSAFTLLAWLVIILNNAQQLFDFLGTAQHSALRARLHRGHAGHGWGDMSFISWWSSSFALGSRCCQRRLKERNKAECGRMWKAVFWIFLIGQLVYKRRHDNVRMYRQCQGMNVSWYESKCYILQRTVLVRFDGEGRLRSWSYFCVGLEMRPSLENYMHLSLRSIFVNNILCKTWPHCMVWTLYVSKKSIPLHKLQKKKPAVLWHRGLEQQSDAACLH